MPRGRPKKIIKKEETVETPQPKTRLQELRDVHDFLLREGIHSISKLEAMISQIEV